MSTDRIEVFVHPNGSRYADGSQGYPVGSLVTAMTLVRSRRAPGQRAVVWIAGGRYPHHETLRLGPADSFTSFVALDHADPPVFDGSAAVTGWRSITVDGRDLLAAPAPAEGGRALYVDGQRRARPRLPRSGRLRMAGAGDLDPAAHGVGTMFDGGDTFTFTEGDVPELSEPERVEVVVPHYWVQERLPIGSIDHRTRTVTSPYRSLFALREDSAKTFATYYLDNVVEALGEVGGEWYLDTTGAVSGLGSSHVLYAPAERESATSLHARLPVIDTFVAIEGEADEPVREIRFEHVAFAYADFATAPAAVPPFGVREDPLLPPGEYGSDIQAAAQVPAAVRLRHAHACAVVGGSISHVGGYGVELGEGTRGALLSGIDLSDLGAGGVRAGGSADAGSPGFVSHNEISDCTIRSGGRVYPGCVGILVQHGAHHVIAHNEISDMLYTAISVGWVWDYHASASVGNIIEGNHLHHLGQGELNDMGGIYLLGIAPGTVIRHNHIHDVQCRNYGGWGIYLDEASSHVVVEGNTVHDTSSQCMHLHYGRENIVRDNLFAFGGEGQIAVTRPEEQTGMTVMNNIILGRGRPAFGGHHQRPDDVRDFNVRSDLNLIWDYEAAPGAVVAANGRVEVSDGNRRWSLVHAADEEWLAAGHDTHSRVADPLLRDPLAGDFTPLPGSPVPGSGAGTAPDAGPRPAAARRHPLVQPTLPDPSPPTRARSVF
ncbi:right-handed parallel beta-helix repeat-containing protein [Ruania suaedae]|uniref:right-handed parallel beta-helix repeat-containing protein n=1 Tax=Ruania suaedae TaxID=2897774 RepID=UPI001E5FE588|nr:right-handed parallel beta-helix repeat-containing protein [Ruania suaedae]UFU02790.1 right-handed parallel beta-helix repeat-containing protein [Ruania suaedae]